MKQMARIENVMSVVIFNEIFMLMTMTIRFRKLLIAPRPESEASHDEICNCAMAAKSERILSEIAQIVALEKKILTFSSPFNAQQFSFHFRDRKLFCTFLFQPRMY